MSIFEPIMSENRLKIYNWQQDDWLSFKFELSQFDNILFQFIDDMGQLSGILTTLPPTIKIESLIHTMVEEALTTSEIEGEHLNREDVVSSIKNNLGFGLTPVKDKRAKGIGDLLIDLHNTYEEKLSEEKLFKWHQMLFQGNTRINSGKWRIQKEPMRVISGAIGKEKVHFEAPPSSIIDKEMKQFIKWFNESGPGGKKEIKNGLVRSAIAHLYFETIHPFEDGNGRIGRVIAEKALSQSMRRPILLGLSPTIEGDKKRYYECLKKASRSNEITEWIRYWLEVILKAQAEAKIFIDFILRKSKFFERYEKELNARKLKAVKKMFEAGTKGFKGGLTAKKYISITKTSKATATRDLQELFEAGILNMEGKGRNTHYSLNY